MSMSMSMWMFGVVWCSMVWGSWPTVVPLHYFQYGSYSLKYSLKWLNIWYTDAWQWFGGGLGWFGWFGGGLGWFWCFGVFQSPPPPKKKVQYIQLTEQTVLFLNTYDPHQLASDETCPIVLTPISTTSGL